MGNEFMYASTSSSTCSSLSLSATQPSSINFTNLNESPFNLTSLVNVSIFENEEYFNYFHKLLQQFNFIEINFKLQQTIQQQQQQQHIPQPQQPKITKPRIEPKPQLHTLKQAQNPKPILNSKPNNQVPVVPLRKSTVARNISNANQQRPSQTLAQSKSTPFSVNNQTSNAINHTNGSGFNLKNISKRLNIKSWFTSSNSGSNSNIPSSASQTNFNSNSNANSQRIGAVKTLAPNTRLMNTTATTATHPPITAKRVSNLNSRNGTRLANNSGVLGSGVGALINEHKYSNKSLMKHSMSEPSLNAILN